MTTTAPSHCSHRYYRDATICQRPLYDGQHCVFHSAAPDKGDAFWEAWEQQVADKDWKCQGYIFPGDLDLSERELKNADFVEATFSGNAYFGGATFFGDAYFGGATFVGNAYFGGAKFSGGASFQDAKFSGNAAFWGAKFSGGASFGGATFEKPILWVGTAFVKASFGGVRWPEHTIFEGVDKVADFGQSTFARSDLLHVTFRRCRLGNVALAEAHSLAEAEYVQIIWGLRREYPVRGIRRLIGRVARSFRRRRLGHLLRSLGRVLPRGEARPVIREERDARRYETKDSFDTAARVYRELRRSYETHRNFPEANDFIYGELEMRRLALGRGSNPQRRWQAWWGFLRRNLLSLEALYFHTSAYGHSWRRALLWLAAIVLLFPLGYALAELDLGNGPFALRPLWESGLDLAAYGQLLVFSLRTAALLPEPTGATLGAGVQALQVVERVLSPILGTLLIIAVRRRFRR